MSGDRIVLVGVAWTLFLIGLLVLREFVRAADAPSWRPLLPFINVLVVVMLGAAGLAAGLQLATLTNPATAAGPRPTALVVTPTATGIIATPPATASPSPEPPMSTPTSMPSSPPPSASLQPPSPSPSPSPTPSPTPAPSPTLTPSSSPTPAPSPTPTPTATTSPPATPSPAIGGTVSAGPQFRAFEVDGNRVTGFQTVRVAQRFTARSSAPQAYSFPSFSDPDGTINLVQIDSGDFAGIYISPDDPGVEHEPGG